MPKSPPRPCRVPGCPGKTTAQHGYCEQHAHLGSWQKPEHPGRRARQGGRPWRRRRDRVLQRDKGLCQPCLQQGRVTPATEVDHILNIARGGSESDDNLQAICAACHREKTQREARLARDEAD
ncbi:HNH endonuclease signature motif containing protein [uncultured Halomonas sp.]|uniref:HNH endonuclease n=1 Tax=uncultured Halomonas sp. TaxID=173971 RepID=UPI00262EC951|nr:HNH endonuclease signature motif containing protein [uncultured Halomonas sp.]